MLRSLLLCGFTWLGVYNAFIFTSLEGKRSLRDEHELSGAAQRNSINPKALMNLHPSMRVQTSPKLSSGMTMPFEYSSRDLPS
ncbi:hypothetical protein BKA80DRAFT_268587 [Phyllosticta citrichinensis]